MLGTNQSFCEYPNKRNHKSISLSIDFCLQSIVDNDNSRYELNRMLALNSSNTGNQQGNRMARPKKESNESTGRTVEVPLMEVKKKRGKPLATRHHQVVTTYAEEVPIDELPEVGQEEELIDDQSIESAIERTPINETEAFLEQAAQSRESYEMFVYRHPNFDIDGDKNPKARGRVFVARMPFNYQTYEADIARYCAKPGMVNIFVPEVRHRGEFRTRLDVVRSEPPIADLPLPVQPNGQPAPSMPQAQYLPYPIQQNNPSVPVDPFREVDRTLGLITKMRQAFVGDEQPKQPEQQLSPKASLLNAMAEHPEIVEAVTDKLMGGSKNGNREPSITELAFKHGAELATAFGNMIQGVVRTVASEFKEIRSIQNQNYEQNEMAAPTLPNQENPRSQVSEFQKQQEGNQGSPQNDTRQLAATNESASQNIQGQSPEEALLTLVCDNCARNIPPKITAQRIDEFAIYINENFPHLSIDGWIEMFTETEVDSIISFASQGAFGEQGKALAGMSHSHKWIGDLREILKQEQPEGENEQ